MNEIIEAIRALLLASLGTTYKKYYYGEVRVPTQAFMPFIEVIPMGTSIKNKGTGGMIENEYSVAITIKNTLKKYLKEGTNVQILEHIQDLIKKMEDRETNGDLKSSCVLGVLHDNLKLSDKANINGDWNITYDEIEYGESYITVATVLFTIKVINY